MSDNPPALAAMLYEELVALIEDPKWFDISTATAVGILEIVKQSFINGAQDSD